MYVYCFNWLGKIFMIEATSERLALEALIQICIDNGIEPPQLNSAEFEGGENGN